MMVSGYLSLRLDARMNLFISGISMSKNKIGSIGLEFGMNGQADAIYPILKHIIPNFGNAVFFCYNIGVTTSREVRT